MENLYAGIDSSTQSTKLLVVDVDTTKVVFCESVNYDKDLPHYRTKNGVVQGLAEGVSESDPMMWVEALELLFDRLKKSPIAQDKIKCISVSGQQHGLVTLDAAGNLTRPRKKLCNYFNTQKKYAL